MKKEAEPKPSAGTRSAHPRAAGESAQHDMEEPDRSAHSHMEGQKGTGGVTTRPWWPNVKRGLTLVFFAAVAYLLVNMARTVDWQEVLAALAQRPPAILVTAALLGAASHVLYSCFDLLGRHYTRHALRSREVMTVTFISYAFNLNLGALVGGLAFRYRMYLRRGLDAEVITRVTAISMLTNWLGYIFLAGAVFLWRPLPLPPDWKVDAGGLQIVGAVLVSVAVGYLLLCAFSRRRVWNVRGHEVQLPSLRFALLQLLMSCLNWMLIAGAVFMLLERQVDYSVVLSVLLAAAIAGVLTHVPAGLGVLEAVFVALLSHQIPTAELLAALLAYRAVYYLVPLLIALLIYLLFEMRAKVPVPEGSR